MRYCRYVAGGTYVCGCGIVREGARLDGEDLERYFS